MLPVALSKNQIIPHIVKVSFYSMAPIRPKICELCEERNPPNLNSQKCAETANNADVERSTAACCPSPCHSYSSTQILAPAQGHRILQRAQVHLLTIIDRLTWWVKAVPLQNVEASTCTDAVIAGLVA